MPERGSLHDVDATEGIDLPEPSEIEVQDDVPPFQGEAEEAKV
jgi:hypothetical protein